MVKRSQTGSFIYNRLYQMHKQQKELAEAIGLPPSTVNSWIMRGRDVPARYLGPVAEFLGVSVYELLGLEEPGGAQTKGMSG